MGRSKVAWWMRLETKEWRAKGVCTNATTKVTRVELEAAEAKEKAFREEYDKFCVKNEAHCVATERCYVDGRHIDGDAEEWSGAVKDKGPVCVCPFPNGRENVDGTGACVQCKSGKDDKPAYVQKQSEPGAQSFHNGEFACALGANVSLNSILV